ncbi:transcriptional regulator [Histophilus somni]|uniref:Transcriptional regulator GcvA n=1 Tax=Histophilus somni TaxID=731 RepID=A0A9Q6Z2A3_HISSO|nr:transcriptional regulator GcvA [Histophilus somni]ARU64579.1 transcriptional regulator [Histophilus somni]ARU66366.1 transcriptional regulator [Histophilus somni]ARU68241.1 transcriptional regulator [Histophilus somni]ARU70119.1 transcriptional regulator [Histophilus somni]ARU71994.1 transcriptional regulator [Histophilus somni]
MIKRLPPLNSLKSFESSARHLSFTKAADELFVTQAAVSHQIKLLEDFLGVILFKRKNRTLELTDLGRAYFSDVSKILNNLADATTKLMAQKNEQYLSISVPQTFGMQWLVPKLSEFNQRYPDIEVRLKGVDQDEIPLSNEIDIAIYYGKGNWVGLQVEKLAEAKLLILASPKLLAKQPVTQATDLYHHNLIHVHTRDNWRNMANLLQLDKLDIRHGPVFSHTFMALQAAVHGQGIVLANKILAQHEIENGNLQVVLSISLPDPKSFYVVNSLNRTNTEQINAFRQWIVHAMKQNKHE